MDLVASLFDSGIVFTRNEINDNSYEFIITSSSIYIYCIPFYPTSFHTFRTLFSKLFFLFFHFYFSSSSSSLICFLSYVFILMFSLSRRLPIHTSRFMTFFYLFRSFASFIFSIFFIFDVCFCVDVILTMTWICQKYNRSTVKILKWWRKTNAKWIESILIEKKKKWQMKAKNGNERTNIHSFRLNLFRKLVHRRFSCLFFMSYTFCIQFHFQFLKILMQKEKKKKRKKLRKETDSIGIVCFYMAFSVLL